MSGQTPRLTRGSDDGHVTLKLLSQEEVTGLIQLLSTWNAQHTHLASTTENIFMFCKLFSHVRSFLGRVHTINTQH